MPLLATEEQRLIDKAIEEHLAAVQVLRYQRNCLASISQLPPEILSRIFSWAKFPLRTYSWQPHNPLAWIKITHVSTHWRSVAMNTPMLWDDPPPENGPWVVEMLKRSKAVGLTVSTDLSTRESRKAAGLMAILRQDGARLQHLALTNMTFECWKVLKSLPVSAPRLEILSLSSRLPGRGPDNIHIPKTVLNNADSLRQLELSGCNVHWHCFPLSNITHLKLRNIACTARPTWTQFIDALAKMSKLESLDIESILDPTVNFTASDTSSGPIYFSLLQRLTVESPTTEVEMFFERVAFPPSAVVHVRGIPQSHPISEISAVISSIARLYSSQEFLILTLRDRDSEFNLPDSVRFQLFPKVSKRLNDINAKAVAKALLTLEFVTSGGQVTIDEIVPEIFKNGLPLDKVSHAELAADITDPDTLMYTFGNLPALSHVGIELRNGIPFVDALYPNTVDSEHFPLYFRSLVSISFTGVKFESEDVERDPDDVSLVLLQDCLIQRYECGAEIQKLSLDDCYRLDDFGVRELENIVVDVDWDEIEQGFERKESDEEEEEEEEEEGEYYPYSGYTVYY
ncbi:hypothetical protein HYPSUDRAFT_48554 [Hypholoma sublateritium FD-334 SS-4]|uniref:Uncharacterized protein n=1 Tax=Hypholoma sublateritium (strain FD-334 SS-4) TaxID=945553 RepID=A0A0D2KKW1_HYPSF|nr:hypothetical protein HYPSUDRAFT_48554 [Hypholoma sublateritium FD-334 SS-4]